METKSQKTNIFYKLLAVFVLSFLVFSNTLICQDSKAVTVYEYDIVVCGQVLDPTTTSLVPRYCAKDAQGNDEPNIEARTFSQRLNIYDKTNVNGITRINLREYPKGLLVRADGGNTRLPDVHMYGNSESSSAYRSLTVTGNVTIENGQGLEWLSVTMDKGSFVNNGTINQFQFLENYHIAGLSFINNGIIRRGAHIDGQDIVINNGQLGETSRIYGADTITNNSGGVFENVKISSKTGSVSEFTNFGSIQELTTSNAMSQTGNFKITNEAGGLITRIDSGVTQIVQIINKGSIPGGIVSVDNPNFSYESQGGASSPMITVGSTTYPPGSVTTVGPPIPSGSSSSGGTTSSGGSSTSTIDKKKESDKIIKDFDKFMKGKPSKTKIEKTTATYLSKIYKLWPNNVNSTTYIKKLINTGIKYLKGLSKNDRLSKEKAFLLKAAKSVKLDKAVPSKVKGKTLTKAQKTKWKNDRIKSVKKTVAKYGVSKLKSADKSTVKNYLKSKLGFSF